MAKLKAQKINSNNNISNPPSIIHIRVPKQPQQCDALSSTVSCFLKGHKTKQAIEKHFFPVPHPIMVMKFIYPNIHQNKKSSHPININQRKAQKQLQQEQHLQHKPLVSTILFITKIITHINIFYFMAIYFFRFYFFNYLIIN